MALLVHGYSILFKYQRSWRQRLGDRLILSTWLLNASTHIKYPIRWYYSFCFNCQIWLKNSWGEGESYIYPPPPAAFFFFLTYCIVISSFLKLFLSVWRISFRHSLGVGLGTDSLHFPSSGKVSFSLHTWRIFFLGIEFGVDSFILSALENVLNLM